MFGLGLPELVVILVMMLLVFGAKRLPEIAGSIGKAAKSFKKELSDVQGSLESTTPSENESDKS
jgi:sec-independent protein translocase protein TatA